MVDWRRAQVATEATHHVLDGAPLYRERFELVMKFHDPGFAPVADASGAYHIDVHGQPVYPQRYRRTFGFYEGVAAVAGDHGWQHVRTDGRPLTLERFAWCGNMQGGRVTVRAHDGSYYHLRPDGCPAYGERYRYAGDYRDGAACVRRPDGAVMHIDGDGRPLSGRAFLDLDVFHKGFARARDDSGWCHCDREGHPVYRHRFVAVEPFYNGQAYCETHDGRRVIIDEHGELLHLVWDPHAPQSPAGPVIILVGNLATGKTVAGHALAAQLRWRFLAIDECRVAHGDGTAAGEAAAWAAFMRILAGQEALVAEYSGSGPFSHLVRHTLSGRRFRVFWLQATVPTCRSRLAQPRPRVPYPDFGVPLDSLVSELDLRLRREMATGTYWQGSEVEAINAEGPEDTVAAGVRRAAEAWLERTVT